MKRISFLLLLCITVSGSYSQINKFGTPVSRSYGMQLTGASEQNWAFTKDNSGNVYFGGDDNFLIKYDGTKWAKIPLNPSNSTIVRALDSDENGIIYIGGTNEFGYIMPDSTGGRTYRTLTDRFSSATDVTSAIEFDTSLVNPFPEAEKAIGEIKSLVIKDSKVCFLSAGSLILYNTLNDSLYYINWRKLGFRQFERIFIVNDRIILANNILGLFELDGNKLNRLQGGDFFSFKMCLTILTGGTDNLIVATFNDGVYKLNYSTGSVDSSFIERKLFNKFKELWVYSGVKLSTGEIVLGTTSDGLYVFDEEGRHTGHWKSSNTELSDNVITAIYTGRGDNSELWVATTRSVSTIYANLPFTRFTEKMGLLGSVNNFRKFDGVIYAATDQGLFRETTSSDGERIFTMVNDINSQIFPLEVAVMEKDSFLLAGSSFNGVYQVNRNGKSILLPFIQDNVRTIYQSHMNRSRFYIGLGNSFLYVTDLKAGVWSIYSKIRNLPGMVARYVELNNGDIVFLTTYPDEIYRLPFNDTIPVRYKSEQGLPEAELTNLNEDNGDCILSTAIGLFKLNISENRWEPYDLLTNGYTKGREVEGIYRSPDGGLWVAAREERNYDILFEKEKDTLVMRKGGPLAALPGLRYLHSSSIEGRYWLTKSNSLYVIDDNKLTIPAPPVQTLLSRVVVLTHSRDSVVMNETFFRVGDHGRRYPVSSNTGQKSPEFRFNLNSPRFFWTTPYMIMEDATLYSYKLEGFDEDWSEWDKVSYKDYTNLSYGKYTFRVKAKTVTEIESREATYSFIILKPWYLTTWMILLYAIAVILSVIGITMAYTKRLKNENIRLEGIVAERTAVVVKQKEELESSIHYASRIQMALLPSEAILEENIKNYFILFKPRDIVSGDFYWMTKKSNRLYIVAADCTGHGVPGAFMSLLGMSFLDEIIDKESAPRADFILNQLRLHVTESLKQVGQDDEAKDGMDIALLVVDYNSQRVEFSGAYNPCFKVRKLAAHEIPLYGDDISERGDGSMSNGKYVIETIYASKMPIGISSRMNEDFVFYDWKLEKGISYYMFSDGYIDQFGGDHGRKFMKKNFKKLLLEIQDYPMKKQKEILEKNLNDWMGQSPQIDDILVMGIRTE